MKFNVQARAVGAGGAEGTDGAGRKWFGTPHCSRGESCWFRERISSLIFPSHWGKEFPQYHLHIASEESVPKLRLHEVLDPVPEELPPSEEHPPMKINEHAMIPRTHVLKTVMLLRRLIPISDFGRYKNLSSERSDTQLAAILSREEITIAEEAVSFLGAYACFSYQRTALASIPKH